jgi:hypothetical protein
MMLHDADAADGPPKFSCCHDGLAALHARHRARIEPDALRLGTGHGLRCPQMQDGIVANVLRRDGLSERAIGLWTTYENRMDARTRRVVLRQYF